jgi:DNA polymerase-3 subunit gamma/tau
VSADEQPEQSQQQRSLYRRHRPRTFADVVGQEPVVRTLRNAVDRNKVHHAYLFVGSRGTGKTSMAKILAACLNCVQGGGVGTIEPCGECDSCRSIAAASSLDVIEMDAASNNSVDDIRELRESVAYAPVSGGRKVYILDEAHMLSMAAWNAFLKTLEEPPPNTVFVLATTEANKVPPTVIDRCHRFDFHRPTVDQIAGVVRRVAEAESISIPPEATVALARSATGSFRDALGTLEQLVTYSGSEIELADVLAVLGVADARLLADTVDAVAEGDSAHALQALEECAEQGRDAAAFASDLEGRLRELLVVQTLDRVPAELSLTPEADAALQEQAARVPHATVVRTLELVGEAMEAVRAGADPRTRLELALVKASRPEVDGSLRALLTRIERLEAANAPGDGGAAPNPNDDRAPDPDDGAAPDSGGGAAPDSGGGAAPDSGGGAAPGQDSPAAAPGEASAPASPVGASATQAAEPGSADPDPLRSLLAMWPAVVDLVRSENALLGALIAEARPVSVRGDEVVLAFATTAQFLKKKAEDPANRMTVAEAMRAITGTRWRLSYELREVPSEQPAQGGERSEEEWVRRFMTEFDAEEVADEWPEVAGEARAAAEQARARAVTSAEKGA